MEVLLPVVLALIVSVIAPSIMVYQTNKQARLVKLEDWARFDALEARAIVAEKRRAADREVIVAKVDGVHALADGTLVASLEAQLEAVRAQAVLMRAANGEAPPEGHAALVAVEAKIVSLEQTLEDRRKALTVDAGAQAGAPA